MKRLFLSLIACWFTAFCFAGNPAYEKAMQQALGQLAQAGSPEAFGNVGNQFERIARAENSEWLPWYYAAYAYITQAAMSQGKEQKDQYLDKAQEFLDQADVLQPEESEVVALQGYWYMIRVSADPGNRGPEMAPKATQILAQAVQMNPDNPRALLLLGQMEYGTAQFFNSDTAKACGLISQSWEKLEQDQPDSPLHPSWGKEMAEAMRGACEQ